MKILKDFIPFLEIRPRRTEEENSSYGDQDESENEDD